MAREFSSFNCSFHMITFRSLLFRYLFLQKSGAPSCFLSWATAQQQQHAWIATSLMMLSCFKPCFLRTCVLNNPPNAPAGTPNDTVQKIIKSPWIPACKPQSFPSIHSGSFKASAFLPNWQQIQQVALAHSSSSSQHSNKPELKSVMAPSCLLSTSAASLLL